MFSNPFHAGRESRYELTVKNSDPRLGGVAPVDPHGTIVLPTGLETRKELGASGRIIFLLNVRQHMPIHRRLCTHDHLSDAVK